MELGLVGLGRMGANMARRLRRAGIGLAAWNRNPAVARALAEETGLTAADSLEALVALLAPPRVLWLMLPAGEVTAQHIERLAPLLTPGDVLVDGANSHYRDSMRRAASLSARGIEFVDAGVSGGVWGLEHGYALMLGGSAAAVARLAPIVKALAPAPDRGWLHCGPAGAGHFVKMVHNGIEYGLMQAYAEGFALLEAQTDFSLDLAAIAEAWRHGTVIRSWLLDLTAAALTQDCTLEGIEPVVADSGEGRWTVEEAVARGVPLPVIAAALMARFASQGKHDYPLRLLAVMRHQFGGHPLRRREAK
ncbi:phosphogluconate dehydrogenase (NAD(+)-dependent, decarboxylating) [Pelomicrobium sp.]|jgi:6-phosphogluconate dehydrogenase|uniref:phosphogluconate dehydrogenase (NAD(+)-dependent, decarboxylating) n=1 Tax=Pelomicrobium sp. TaxID=2815319 RepID=UPI002FDDC7EF